MTIKRYKPDLDYRDLFIDSVFATMEETPDGAYVKYTDVVEILQVLKALDASWSASWPEGPETDEGYIYLLLPDFWREIRTIITKFEGDSK